MSSCRAAAQPTAVHLLGYALHERVRVPHAERALQGREGQQQRALLAPAHSPSHSAHCIEWLCTESTAQRSQLTVTGGTFHAPHVLPK
jgi:hypothetical protein